VLLVWVATVHGGNYPVAVVQRGNCPWWQLLWVAIVLGGSCPGGSSPRPSSITNEWKSAGSWLLLAFHKHPTPSGV